MRKTTLKVAAATLALATPSIASAAVVLDESTPTGPTAPGTDIEFVFDAMGGDGSITTTIDAFGSVDGVSGSLTDTFTILLNGVEFFSSSFALGGRGTNHVFTQPAGASFSVNPNGGFGNGGSFSLSSPISLVDGSNSLTFRFAGTGSDEFFGVNSVQVNDVAVAVPEPATWAMLLLGFFGIGGALRYSRRKARQTVSFA